MPLAIGLGVYKLETTIFCTRLVGETLSFAVNLPHYLQQVDARPRGSAPKLLVFNNGGMFFASSGVVYDESDEVRLPRDEQSDEWKVRADRTELGCGGFRITPLFGHFYLAGFPC